MMNALEGDHEITLVAKKKKKKKQKTENKTL